MAVDLATNALLELDTLKTELGISGSGDDDYLKRIINRVSDQIEQYISRKIYWEEDIVEKTPGFPTSNLMTKRIPLLSISSITYDGDTVDSDNYEIVDGGETGLIYRPGGWTWTAEATVSPTQDVFTGTERELYEITYTAGYITAKQETDGDGTRSLPWDIEDAATMLAVLRYRQKGRSLGIQEEGTLSTKVKYFDSASGSMPQSIKDILEPYREGY